MQSKTVYDAVIVSKVDIYNDFKTHQWPYEEQFRSHLSPNDHHNYKYGFADSYTMHIHMRLQVLLHRRWKLFCIERLRKPPL